MKRADMIADDVWSAFQDFLIVGNAVREEEFKRRVAASVAYHLDDIVQDLEVAIKDINA